MPARRSESRAAWCRWNPACQPGEVATLLADSHEVTNQQYRYCVEAQRCQAPDEPPSKGPSFANGNGDLPVVWVTAYDAADFCAWLGGRLPHVAEWRRTA